MPLGTWFGHPLGLTEQGLTSVGLIVTRVATSISLVVLLTLTTPWPKLLAALRALSAPRMFILVLGMAYRYLFHLLDSVTDMYTARRSRTVTRDADVTSGRAFVAASAGRSSARPTRSPKRCTWRWWRGVLRRTRVARIHVRRVDVTFALACASPQLR